MFNLIRVRNNFIHLFLLFAVAGLMLGIPGKGLNIQPSAICTGAQCDGGKSFPGGDRHTLLPSDNLILFT